MDIVITDVRVTASQQMVFELFRAGIKEIQPPVFGSNPDVTVGIFAELADYISRKRIFRTIGIIPLDILMLGRQVTHSTEISPDPDSPFPILITGIDTFFILFVVGRQTFSCCGVECIKSVVGTEIERVGRPLKQGADARNGKRVPFSEVIAELPCLLIEPCQSPVPCTHP